MYEAYWGLNCSPFGSAAGREALASSPVHAEALARLDYLRESHSPLGLLVGAGGSGKSAVLAEFAARAAREGSLVGLIPAAAAEETHVLPAIAESLHVAADGNPAAQWRAVADRLAELRFAGLTAVLLLDDLDRAAASTLNLVERMLALPAAPLTVVAVARPESASRLGRHLL